MGYSECMSLLFFSLAGEPHQWCFDAIRKAPRSTMLWKCWKKQ